MTKEPFLKAGNDMFHFFYIQKRIHRLLNKVLFPRWMLLKAYCIGNGKYKILNTRRINGDISKRVNRIFKSSLNYRRRLLEKGETRNHFPASDWSFKIYSSFSLVENDSLLIFRLKIVSQESALSRHNQYVICNNKQENREIIMTSL